MEGKNRLIRTIAIIGMLVMVIVTVLPGCNFIGQAGKNDGSAVTDEMGNELCCPLCKSTDISGPDDAGYYICNACGQKWQYNDTQIDVVDPSGNVVSTMGADEGYVSGGSYSGGSSGGYYGGGSSSGGNSYNGGGSSGGGNSYNGGSSTGGNTSGGNTSGGNTSGGNTSGGNTSGGNVYYTTQKNTSEQVKQNLAKIANIAKNLDKSIEIIYDEETQSYTVKSKDGTDTGLFGYKYSTKDKIFYTAEDSWQRNFGFNEVYDDAAAVGFMTYNTFRVYFEEGGLEWMIQFWKGQYGYAFVGSEIGVYTRPKGSGNGSTHYQCADDAHKFYMTMNVYRQNPDNKNKYDYLFTRSRCKTWWCTGFVPGTLGFAQVNVPDEDGTAKLKVDSKIEFNNEEQAQGFINGLRKVTYLENNAAFAGTKRSVNFVECANEAEYAASSSSNKFCLCSDGKSVRICYR